MRYISLKSRDTWKEKIILGLMSFFKINFEVDEESEELDFRKFDKETQDAALEADELIRKGDYSKFKNHQEIFSKKI